MIRREIEATSSSLDTCGVPERWRLRKTEGGGEEETRAYHHHRCHNGHGGDPIIGRNSFQLCGGVDSLMQWGYF